MPVVTGDEEAKKMSSQRQIVQIQCDSLCSRPANVLQSAAREQGRRLGEWINSPQSSVRGRLHSTIACRSLPHHSSPRQPLAFPPSLLLVKSTDYGAPYLITAQNLGSSYQPTNPPPAHRPSANQRAGQSGAVFHSFSVPRVLHTSPAPNVSPASL